MAHRVAGVWHPEPGDFQLQGLWYPDGDEITKYMVARLQTEPFYRADRLADALKHIRNFRGAVDCGAWVGAWSRELSKHFERVVAIDIHPDNARCIAKNCSGNVSVVNCALGKASGTAAVQRSTYAGTIESWVVPDGDGPVVVPMKRLDDVREVQELPAVDYLKVHVNGAELLVLQGAEQTIRRHRPVMTIVIKPALTRDFGNTPAEVYSLMESFGYVVASALKPYFVFAPR